MLRATLLLLVSSALSFAAPTACVPGTLQDYINLGADGCQLGARMLSDIELTALLPVATEIDPSAIAVTPSVLGSTGSLLFTFNASAEGATVLQSVFQMTVTPDVSAGETVGVRLFGAGATGNGVVTGVADLCPDEELAFGFCFVPSTPLITLVDANTNIPFAQGSLGPMARFGAALDFTVDAGVTGAASLPSAELTFTTVPEPGTAFGLIAGLSLFLLVRRRI